MVYILAKHIAFQIDPVPGPLMGQDRLTERMGNDGYGKCRSRSVDHGQADAVNGDGAFGNNEFKQ
ncbi:hypothetical protein D3C74_413820 [compost metagenome]